MAKKQLKLELNIGTADAQRLGLEEDQGRRDRLGRTRRHAAEMLPEGLGASSPATSRTRRGARERARRTSRP